MSGDGSQGGNIGSEWVGVDQNQSTGVVPFGNLDGAIGIMGDAYWYDGFLYSGGILDVDEAGYQVKVKVDLEGSPRWPSDEGTQAPGDEVEGIDDRINLSWLYMTSGTDAGKWFRISHWGDTGEDGYPFLYIFANEPYAFNGEVDDTFLIGVIGAIRDFAYIRPNGSAQITHVNADHEIQSQGGAITNGELWLKTFSQGLKSGTLTEVGESQIDDEGSISDANDPWVEINYDDPPSVSPRGSRIMIRLVAFTQMTKVIVRQLRVRGKQWSR